jgi:hypothetical protein
VTRTGMRPCSLVWIVFAGMLMATTPVAAELPVSVLYDTTDVSALAAPDRVAQVASAVTDQARPEAPRPRAERVSDAEIHLP